MAGIVEVELSKLIPSTVREEFDEESLRAMAETLKTQGVLEPLRVMPKGDRYQVIFGERRRRAAEMAGLAKVPVIIQDKPLSDQELLQMQLVENLQREDLTVMEKAKAYKRLMEMGLSGKEIARRLGVTEKYVSEFVALLKLSEKVQAKVEEARRGRMSTEFGKLGRFQARLIAAYTDDPKLQEELTDAVIANKLKQTETRDLLAILKDMPDISVKEAVEILKGRRVVKETPSKVWRVIELPKKVVPALTKIAEERKLGSLEAAVLWIINEFLEKRKP